MEAVEFAVVTLISIKSSECVSTFPLLLQVYLMEAIGGQHVVQRMIHPELIGC